MEGQMWDAVLESAPEGKQVVVLSNEEVLSPENADFGEFSIVEATEDEREILKQAGYSMPDWSPSQGSGCAGCHLDDTQVER
jgi:hypothetical protein